MTRPVFFITTGPVVNYTIRMYYVGEINLSLNPFPLSRATRASLQGRDFKPLPCLLPAVLAGIREGLG
jgi:hypothetical protein